MQPEQYLVKHKIIYTIFTDSYFQKCRFTSFQVTEELMHTAQNLREYININIYIYKYKVTYAYRDQFLHICTYITTKYIGLLCMCLYDCTNAYTHIYRNFYVT